MSQYMQEVLMVDREKGARLAMFLQSMRLDTSGCLAWRTGRLEYFSHDKNSTSRAMTYTIKASHTRGALQESERSTHCTTMEGLAGLTYRFGESLGQDEKAILKTVLKLHSMTTKQSGLKIWFNIKLNIAHLDYDPSF